MPKNLPIQLVSRMTGLTIHTLRAWEKRYQAVTPKRDKSNTRLYSQADIERLQKLKALTGLGSRISEVASLSDSKLEAMLIALQPDLEFIKTQKDELATEQMLEKLKLALSLFDLEMLSHELSKIQKKISSRDFALKIIHPVLKEVGRLFEANELSVDQEHAISSMLKFHIGNFLYQNKSFKKIKGLVFVFAAPEGELHEFGIMIGALLCQQYNHNFYYVGPNMPAGALSVICNQLKADFLILGVSHSYTQDIKKYFNTLYSSFETAPHVWLGGERFYQEDFNWKNFSKLSSFKELDKKLSLAAK